MQPSPVPHASFKVYFFSLILLCFSTGSVLPADTKSAVVIPVQGTIDLGLSSFIARGIREAQAQNASLLIFQIDTFGGRVDAAIQIRDAILASKIDSVAFINKRAISAGALISLSCKKILMADAGTIGAAKPVQIGLTGTEPQPTDEKTVSYLRKEFKATAEQNGYPTQIAEAFVDQDVAIEGLNEKGKLLTLTTQEALQWKVATAKAQSIEQVLHFYGMAGAAVIPVTATWSENLVRFLTHPIVSSALIALGLLGIWVEIKTPGTMVPGIVGAVCILIFFFGHYLVGLANWMDLVLFLAGITLILLEIFVIPGFGVAGLGGIALVIASLFMALIKRPLPDLPVPQADWMHAFNVVGSSIIGSAAVAFVLYRFVLPHTTMWGKIVLGAEIGKEKGYVSTVDNLAQWIGKNGIAETQLRPAGKVRIGAVRLDAVTQGDLIDKDTRITVIGIVGPSVLVRKSGT